MGDDGQIMTQGVWTRRADLLLPGRSSDNPTYVVFALPSEDPYVVTVSGVRSFCYSDDRVVRIHKKRPDYAEPPEVVSRSVEARLRNSPACSRHCSGSRSLVPQAGSSACWEGYEY